MKNRISLTLIIVILPVVLLAHGTHGSGFTAGFTHPILGIDHNLAIMGVGILGYLLDTKNWYLYPSSFLILMIVAGFIGVGQPPSTFAETIIVISIFTTGFLLFIGGRVPSQAILVMMAMFGFFHGYAHGIEKPEGTSVAIYVFGYSVGVLLLSSMGWGIARTLSFLPKSKIGYQIIGCLMMFYSALMLL